MIGDHSKMVVFDVRPKFCDSPYDLEALSLSVTLYLRSADESVRFANSSILSSPSMI